MRPAALFFIESNTTGTGRLFVLAARKLGYDPALITAQPEKYAYLSQDGAPEVVEVPWAEEHEIEAAIRRHLRARTELGGITSSSERFIAMAATLAARFGLPGPDPECVRAVRDKSYQRQVLAAAGLPTPAFRIVESASEAADAAREIGVPVVVKPVNGTGSMGVRACGTAAEAGRHATSLLSRDLREDDTKRVLVESLIDGPEVSVEVFSGRVVGITRKHLGAPPYFVEAGHDYPVPLSRHVARTLIDTVKRATTLLGLTWGPIHWELRLHDGEAYAIEVNPRLAGGFIPELVRHAEGIDLIRQTLHLVVGQRPNLTRRRHRFASIRFLFAPHDGVFCAADEAFDGRVAGDVVDAAVYRSPGDELRARGDFRDRIGHVMTCSDQFERACSAAERARDAVHVRVDAFPDVGPSFETTAFSAGTEGGWAVLELSSAAGEAPVAHRGQSPLRWIERDVHSADDIRRSTGDTIAVLAPGSRNAFVDAAPDLLAEIGGETDWAVLLVPWKEPPLFGRRHDGPVHSFVASRKLMRQLLAQQRQPPLADLSFLLFDAILNRTLGVPRLYVRQIGGTCHRPRVRPLADRTALIMAHRGEPSYLRTALEFIDRAASAMMLNVGVGLDVDDLEAYVPLAAELDRHQMFAVDDPPAGPYVIRQGLIERSREEFLVFQDSDDISCHDRFVVQHEELTSSDADLVGCQEIEVDEIKRCVEAIRFPRDVTAALACADSATSTYKEEEPLLHGTVMVRRRAFVGAGGFSTDQRIANDTQFMLRAYFSVRMRNSAEFLYIRRRHSNALTVARRTAAGCELRRSLASKWASDFEAVKRGAIELSATSLQARPNLTPHPLRQFAIEQPSF